METVLIAGDPLVRHVDLFHRVVAGMVDEEVRLAESHAEGVNLRGENVLDEGAGLVHREEDLRSRLMHILVLYVVVPGACIEGTSPSARRLRLYQLIAVTRLVDRPGQGQGIAALPQIVGIIALHDLKGAVGVHRDGHVFHFAVVPAQNGRELPAPVEFLVRARVFYIRAVFIPVDEEDSLHRGGSGGSGDDGRGLPVGAVVAQGVPPIAPPEVQRVKLRRRVYHQPHFDLAGLVRLDIVLGVELQHDHVCVGFSCRRQLFRRVPPGHDHRLPGVALRLRHVVVFDGIVHRVHRVVGRPRRIIRGDHGHRVHQIHAESEGVELRTVHHIIRQIGQIVVGCPLLRDGKIDVGILIGLRFGGGLVAELHLGQLPLLHLHDGVLRAGVVAVWQRAVLRPDLQIHIQADQGLDEVLGHTSMYLTNQPIAVFSPVIFPRGKLAGIASSTYVRANIHHHSRITVDGILRAVGKHLGLIAYDESSLIGRRNNRPIGKPMIPGDQIQRVLYNVGIDAIGNAVHRPGIGGALLHQGEHLIAVIAGGRPGLHRRGVQLDALGHRDHDLRVDQGVLGIHFWF